MSDHLASDYHMSALMMAAWLFAAAEIFMTGSEKRTSFAVSMQPGLSEHLSEAFAAEMMQVASEKEESTTHIPAAGAYMCFHFDATIF